MQKILNTVFLTAALVLMTACSGNDDQVSVLDLDGSEDTAGVPVGGGGGTGGTGGTGGGTQTYSVTLLGVELQQKGGTNTVPVGGLPIDGATVTGP